MAVAVQKQIHTYETKDVTMGFTAELRPIADPEPDFGGHGQVVGHWNWRLTDGAGAVLARLSATFPPLGSALAALRADHGYPAGRWEPDGDGYRFVAGEAP